MDFSIQSLLICVFFNTLQLCLSQLTWSELGASSSATPSGRSRPALAFDEDNNMLLVFGGKSSDGILEDTWTFNLTSEIWSEISTSNTPGERFDAIAGCFKNQFIISTGEGDNKVFYDDIWSLDYLSGNGTSWIRLDQDSSKKPDERYGSAGGLITTDDVNDENYGKFYISHGFSSVRYSDTFVFDLNNTDGGWKQVFDGTTPYSPDLPHPRCLVATTSNSEGFTMFGGCLASGGAGGPCPALDGWYYEATGTSGDNSNWNRMDDIQIPSLNSDMCNYWNDDKYSILYGGDQSLKSLQKVGGTEINDKDLHFLNTKTGKWSSYDSSNAPGFAVESHRMVTTSDSCIVFGGQNTDNGDYLNTVYVISGTIDGLKTNGVEYSYFSVLYLHGIFMWLSWGVFLQIGGFMGHFARKLKRKGWWFKPWHVYCQRIGYCLNIIGIICAFLGQGNPAFAHGIIGIIIFILSTFQVISGERRPHVHEGQEKSKARIIFEIFHKKTNGRLLLILGLINISLGVFLIIAPVAVWVLWFIQFSIIVIAYIIFELDKRDIIKLSFMRNNEYKKDDGDGMADGMGKTDNKDKHQDKPSVVVRNDSDDVNTSEIQPSN